MHFLVFFFTCYSAAELDLPLFIWQKALSEGPSNVSQSIGAERGQCPASNNSGALSKI